MLDDVAGLVMVQVISNLGNSAGTFAATTVVRPVFVSIAFAVVVPLVCRVFIQPLARRSLMQRPQGGVTAPWIASPATALSGHTLLLVA